jgi:glucose/arabinose dehydrogenase
MSITGTWGRLATLAIVAILGIASFGPAAEAGAAPTLPAGFSDSLVVAAERPTGLAFTPDGRMLLITQTGQLYIPENGGSLPAPALDLSARICSNKERGLLGITVDPRFAENGFIYLFYTHNSNPCENENVADVPMNRVSRFTLSSQGSVDPASEVVLMDGMPSVYGWHDGADLGFGANGFLYVSLGDGTCQVDEPTRCQNLNNNSRRRDLPLGKILRIAPDGSVPSTNPFYNEPGARRCASPTGPQPGSGPCIETFAWGLRNPFRFAFEPGTNRFLINDVGTNHWEEINRGIRGADYGFNLREGHCTAGSYTDCPSPPAEMVDPIYDYAHSGDCSAITGGAFVPPSVWPDTFDGDYLFSDYVCGKIFRLDNPWDGPATVSDFVTSLEYLSAIDLVFGPHAGSQSLFYTTYANGGEVRRIDYDWSGNGAPTASMSVAPRFGALPLEVTFDASASTDPEGDDLTYLWNFGDGTPVVQTQSATTSHTYEDAGGFEATVRVRDELGRLSGVVRTRIDAGNEPPEITITSPDDDYRFAVGDEITLEAVATDPQDGPLPGHLLEWEVLKRHADHYHPYAAPEQGSSITIPAPPPEDLAAVANSSLEVIVTATDSLGAERRITHTLLPAMVDVTFDTIPDGRRINVNGEVFRGERPIDSWADYAFNVGAPKQLFRDLEWRWDRWTDGAPRNRVIFTPEVASSYGLVFRPVEATGSEGCFGLPPTITGTDGPDRLNGTSGRDVIDGLEGADVIRGFQGFDVVCGGPGRDELRAGASMDALDGGRGDDLLVGGSGFDYVYGKDGRDECAGQFLKRC